MTEMSPPETRRLNEWYTKRECDRERECFIEKHRGQFLEFFNASEHFTDLSLEARSIGANLMSRFLFGVGMANRRFGFKYSNCRISYDAVGRDDVAGFAFLEDTNQYTINLNFLKKSIKYHSSRRTLFLS